MLHASQAGMLAAPRIDTYPTFVEYFGSMIDIDPSHPPLKPASGEGRRTPSSLMKVCLAATVCLLTSCDKPAPLSTSFRRSAMDAAGLVLLVKNTSDKSLICKMSASNKTLNKSTSYTFPLPPHESTEIGILETAWSFHTGEKVRIEVEGFRTLAFEVP